MYVHSLRERNDCHHPGGSPEGGRFAPKGSGVCHPTGNSKGTPRQSIAYAASHETEDRWNDFFGNKTGVTLQEVVDAYSIGLTPSPVNKVPAKVKWDDSEGHFAVTVIAGGTVVQRNIIPGRNGYRPYVYHEALLLDGKTQAQGLGKQMMAETFRLYERMGISDVNLHANIDVGAYAWARYGFDFDPGGSPSATAFQSGTLARANILADWNVITTAQARDLAKASGTPGGGVWKVADTKMKVAPSQAKKVVDGFLDYRAGSFGSSSLRDNLTTETIARLHADAEAGIIPVGKLLLLDRYWPARFTLSNAAQRDRLRAYVGRDVFKD